MSNPNHRKPIPEVIINKNIPKDTVIVTTAKDDKELFIPNKTIIIKTKQKWYSRIIDLWRIK